MEHYFQFFVSISLLFPIFENKHKKKKEKVLPEKNPWFHCEKEFNNGC